MIVKKVAGKKVLEIPFEVQNKENIIRTVETSISLLTYVKPKLRTLIVPGDAHELPDELPGGLFKATQTQEGTLYTSGGSGPGIQIESNIYFDDDTINLFKSIYNIIVDLHKEQTGEKYLPSYQHSWFFINPPSEEESNFHDHKKFNSTFPNDTPTYTWTYYLQLPDNCVGEEGMLAFKASNESLHELIDVKLNTIYVFPSDLLHQPNLSPKSTLNRITAAGNILIPASEKSLFSE